MAPLALALQLALASPGLAPPLDPGPFRGQELVAASAGVFLGDALVLGSGYLTLQLFANGALSPSASNFRTAAYAFGVAALVVPPLTGVLLARWARARPASGAVWKALLLASAGQAAALAAGYAASPHLWVVLPVQLVTIALGASFGLHWGPRALDAQAQPPGIQREARRGARREDATAEIGAPFCPDPAAG